MHENYQEHYPWGTLEENVPSHLKFQKCLPFLKMADTLVEQVDMY